MLNSRQKQIAQYLAEAKYAKAEQLAAMFDVSLETIRRDLLELERNSSVKKIRGGAVYNTTRAKELEFAKKMANTQQGT